MTMFDSRLRHTFYTVPFFSSCFSDTYCHVYRVLDDHTCHVSSTLPFIATSYSCIVTLWCLTLFCLVELLLLFLSSWLPSRAFALKPCPHFTSITRRQQGVLFHSNLSQIVMSRSESKNKKRMVCDRSIHICIPVSPAWPYLFQEERPAIIGTKVQYEDEDK